MHLDIAQITGIGDRQTNQDALASALADDLACFVLADGTGGHEGGELAANLVVDSIIGKFLQEASFSARALRSYVDWAIHTVAQQKAGNLKQQQMSATVATLLIDRSNRCALWAHLGDTRIYLFRRGKIIAISKDHSQAQRMVDAGYAEYATLRQHPQRSVLFAAIGAEGDSIPEITTEAITLQEGDAFLMCSDGFWEWVHEDEMEQTLVSAPNTDAWLSQMAIIAGQNNSTSKIDRDNFSAFAVCLKEADTAANRMPNMTS
ncbi:protein phosphatase 2C domain-containing protein [Undibacterium sp. Jales W-56]|uniref:PP2C family protein-serine/threonine phosphatase n=1 Tax=Undibacterium sp. Jales W-56 TaxID=2897325 RepID=UPI0021D3A524|nr:protein phosphatase 2C domain-containing protein [Undibacterium sp. Jales W-56]MCU6432793.1 protein phosphatase 2C domain-containing protein [Undibacterium sp. Jales W-56]